MIYIKPEKTRKKKNYNLALLITFLMGVVFLVSTYAWFYASLDVKVKFINLVVSNNSGLTISLDGINFGSSIQVSKDNLIETLKNVYPNNTSQWPMYGLRPVSTNGIKTSNDEKFNIFYATSAEYRDDRKIDTYLSTKKMSERTINAISSFVAFDIFLKNVTGSPISDNLYLDNGTDVSIIYEPHSTEHTDLAKERASKYGINLMSGTYYPTYGMINAVRGVNIMDIVDGSNHENFELQTTMVDFSRSLFEVPDGITKVRVYVWLEGQDIDSLETKSTGANLSIKLNFIKDTAGYDYYNE